MTEVHKKRRGGTKIAPEIIEMRLKQGTRLVEEKEKSQAKYKDLARWMHLDEKEAYKYYIAAATFGGEWTKLFHLEHLYATNWAIILQCSGQGRNLQTRHAVMAMVHYGMYLAERQQPTSRYAIPNDLPFVNAVLNLSEEQVRTLFVHMMQERNIPLNEDEQRFLDIDVSPLFSTIEKWAHYYKERERASNRGEIAMQNIADDLYIGSGDTAFNPTPLEEEQCIQSIMSSARNTEDYDMVETTLNGHEETEIVVDSSIQAHMKAEFNRFLATYIPPSGEEFELLRQLNTELTEKKIELDAMVVQLLEENEALRTQLLAAEETLTSVKTMISDQLNDARAMVTKKQQ